MHRDYDGGDLVLPGDPSVVLRAAEEPALAACKGMTIVTADGTTLLGADDKAGVAEILEVLWRFREEPSRGCTAPSAWRSRPTKRWAAAPSTST